MALVALIFDVDGTLADTERNGHRVAYNYAFRSFGLGWEWDPDLYGALLAVHGGKERLHYYVQKYRPEFRQTVDLDGFIEDMHAVKTRRFIEIVRRAGLPVRTGIRRLLSEARDAGLRLAIATTTSRQNVDALLETSVDPGAVKWFATIAAEEDADQKKPAPDVYQEVLQRMEIQPHEALAFEDSRNGLLSAIGAGIRTVVTVNPYTQYEDFSGAILVLDHLGEPDQAFRVLSAQVPISGYSNVDVALLRYLEAHT